MVACLALAAYVLRCSLQPVIGLDTDFWWHLAGGREMVQSGSLPLVDHFSHTSYGHTWVRYHWGYQLLEYCLYLVGGMDAAIFLRTVLFLGAATLLVLAARTRGAGLAASLLAVLWCASMVARYWHVRPHFLSLFFGALCIYLLELGHPKFTRWLPVVILVWSNCHGGVSIIGVAIVAVYAITEWKRAGDGRFWASLVGLCTLALLCTPQPWPVFTYATFWAFVPNPWRPQIDEYARPDFLAAGNRSAAVYLAVCVVGSMVAWWRRRQYRDLRDMAMVAVFLPLLLSAVRHQFLLLPYLAPVLARQIQRLLDRVPRLPVPVRAALLIVLCVCSARDLVLAARLGSPPSRLIRRETTPDSACLFLQRHGWQGRLFNDFTWGGYFLWALPTCPVFIDSRCDQVYENSVLDEYDRIMRGDTDALQRLDHHQVDIVVERIGFDDTPLFTKILPSSADWWKAYEDTTARVYVRRSRFAVQPLAVLTRDNAEPYMAEYVQGMAAMNERRSQDAIAHLTESLHFYPDNPRCHVHLGVAYGNAGDGANAERQWRLALLLHERLLTVHYNLGILASLQGRSEDAACEFSQELELDPNSQGAAQRLQTLPRPGFLCVAKQRVQRFLAPLSVW